MPNLLQHGLSHGPLGGDSIPGMPWDPQNGLYLCDDFNYKNATAFNTVYDGAAQAGGLISFGNAPTSGMVFGFDNIKRSQSFITLATWTGVGNSFQGYAFSRGLAAQAANSGLLQLGFGPCEIKTRMGLINSGYQPGSSLMIRFGFWNQNANFSSSYFGNPWGGACFLEWNCDQNGGAMRIGYSTLGGNNPPLYVNCASGAPTFNNWDWWSLLVDAAGNATAKLNGIIVGTASAVAPMSPLVQVPFWSLSRTLTTAVNYELAIDDFYLYYPYNRR